MKLSRVRIVNFRLFLDATIELSKGGLDLKGAAVGEGDSDFPGLDSTTILVGPNNCGKTSVAEAFQLFVSGGMRSFSVNDFSISARGQFDKAEQSIRGLKSKASDILTMLPSMHLDLLFDHDDDAADLAVAWDLMMDLDASDVVAMRIRFEPVEVELLSEEVRRLPDKTGTLYSLLSRRLGEFYKLRYYKLRPGTDEAIIFSDKQIVSRVIKVDYLFAQRHVDDNESSRATRLSSLLHLHYETHWKHSEPERYDELENALIEHATELSEKYESSFDDLKQGVELFGTSHAGGLPQLAVRAELRSSDLLGKHTSVYYRPRLMESAEREVQESTHELPEKYNGLGYKNLIYMILQLQSFRLLVMNGEQVRPRVHLLFIEEPEAHLHPQVQTVFLRQLWKLLNRNSPARDAQVILTTHSPHIVAECGFRPVRYFRNKGRYVIVKDLLRFQTQEASHDPGSHDGTEGLNFLRRYISLTHCDMFFANKLILVEGACERLLMPLMISEVGRTKIQSEREYISVIEVGGSHAVRFRSILNFLELPTLVITDLDSTGVDGKACPVAEGSSTANYTLASWIPGMKEISRLLVCDDSQRTDGCVRVVYQMNHGDPPYCARSFEEALIVENLSWVRANGSALSTVSGRLARIKSEMDLKSKAYDLVRDDKKKVGFALDLMMVSGWQTPAYIRDGLYWLATYGGHSS